MPTPLRTVSLTRLKTASDCNQQGWVKLIHIPTGKWYLVKGRMFDAAIKEFELLRSDKHPNKRLQRCYNAEGEFSIEFYPTSAAGKLRKELMDGIHTHLIL